MSIYYIYTYYTYTNTIFIIL